MTTRIFKGLVAASYTPMHEDESIAPEVIAPCGRGSPDCSRSAPPANFRR